MDSRKFKIFAIIAVAMVFAVYLGIAAATAQLEAVAWVAGILGIVLVLALGRQVWTLIPAALGLQGLLNFIPGSPPPWALASAVVATMFAIRFTMRRPDFTWRFTWLDAAVLLQLVAVAQAFVRNPTGLMLLGGDLAGGKTYFVFAAAILGYFCLSIAKPSESALKGALVALIAVLIADGMLATASDYFPAVAAAVLPIYSNVNLLVAVAGRVDIDLSEVRGGAGFAQLGRALAMPCLMMARPLKCLNPFNFHLFLPVTIGGILVLFSGFRSGAAYLAAVFIVSALVRRKLIDVLVVSFAGIIFLCGVVMTGLTRELPFGVQRVLSVLPIDVESGAREDATKSSEWRFEMWRLALGTDRYIDNKWLGDGFAMSNREMSAIMDAAQGVSNYMDSSQEQALAKGSYHGFHVETIRFTGYFGLVCALTLMVVAFSTARRIIRMLQGTPLHPWALYVGIPFLLYPFWSMLVFGAYRAEFPQIIVMAGMLKMLENLIVQQKSMPVERPEALPLKAGAALQRA